MSRGKIGQVLHAVVIIGSFANAAVYWCVLCSDTMMIVKWLLCIIGRIVKWFNCEMIEVLNCCLVKCIVLAIDIGKVF